MNRFTSKRGDHLHYGAWLVADNEGGLKLVRGEPTTGRGEIAIALNLVVPLALFRKPLLRASVTVPPQSMLSEAEALQAVVEVVRSGSDFDVDVQVAK